MRKFWVGLWLVVVVGVGCVTDVGGESRPVAVVGEDGATSIDQAITLDGSGSYVPGSPSATLAYSWTVAVTPAAGAGTLSSATEEGPTLTGTEPGLYVVQLVVTHGEQSSKPAYANVRVFELALPPAASAGPDQTVDPGSTVTLDGSGSLDPNGGALTYAWSQTAGTPVTLSDATAESPTFTSPLPVEVLSFELIVTDPGSLVSQPDTVVITIADLPPVAVIVAPPTGDEGGAVALDGTTSSDPNGDPGTAFTYAWTVQSNIGVALTDATIARPAFTVPSFCGAEQVIVGLTVTVAGQSSPAASATVDLQDIQNDAPTADAGTDQLVGEGDTVTLDGSAAADCNGDALTYAWAQTGGPGVTLSDIAAPSPTFTAPAVLADTPYTFLLTVSDPGGLSSNATVIVTVQNTVNEAPVANAGPPQSVQVQATVTLDGSASSDPNGDGLTYAWAQSAGTGVTLSNDTAMQPTFTAPNTPGALSFDLLVNDGAVDSAPASVTITVNPAGPDLNNSTITTADPSLTADGSSTTLVTVTVVDGVGNLLTGQTIVINTSAGSLLGAVSDNGDGTYTRTLQAPTATGTGLLDFTIGGQAAAATASVAFLPGLATGTITLFAAPSAIPADGSSTSTVTSVAIVDANGNAVADGTMVTISTDLGTITTADADGGTPGIQVATAAGIISFVLQSQVGVGTANLQANTVTGTASGSTTVPFQTGLPEGTINLVVASATRVADGSSTTQVTGGPVTDSSGNPVPDGTLITVSIDSAGAPGAILDADEDAVTPGIQVSTTGGTFVITVQSGTQSGTLTVNVASAQGSATGTADVNLIPGPAAGVINLSATPDPIAVSGTTSPLPTTTTVTSSVITDSNGNAVPDGTMVTVTADLGSSITTFDADAAPGIQVATVGGVIAFDIDSSTGSGTLNVGATVDGASGSTTVTVEPGPATAIVYVSGTPQTGVVGTALGADLVVRTEDANLNPVPGEVVNFAATVGGGSLLPTNDTTDAAGEARTTATLGTASGASNNTFEATAPIAGSPIIFTASADPNVAVSFDVTGHPSPSIAGTAQTVTLTARDQYGNVATGYTGTVTLSSSDGSAVLPGDYTFVGGDAGVTTVSVELRTAGTQNITATDTVSGSITGSQVGIQVDAGAATDIIYVSGTGQSGQISSALAQPLVVRTDDAFGNPVAGETVNFAATVGGGGVLPASDTTNAAGEAQTVGTVGSTVGTDNNTFEATAALTGSPITFLASVTSGPADHIVYVSGDAQTGTVGAALASELVVRVEDAGNNPVTGYSVDFAATAGGGGALPASDLSDAAGEARTTATLGITSGTNNNTFDATAALTGSPITFTASADADVAVSLDVTGHPSPSTAGTSQSVTVTARDQYGNVATGYTGTIAVSSSDGSAVLPADYTFLVGDNGVATVSVELRTAGSQDVSVADTVSAGVNGSQTGIQVDAGVATDIIYVSGTGQSGQISSALALPLVVRTDDAFGNPVAGETVNFAATVGGGGVLPASDTTNAAGLAQTVGTVGSSVGTDNNTFEATAALTGSPITFLASVTSGPADHIVYVSGDAQTGTVGVALAAEFVVRVEDAGNNPVAGYTVNFADTSGGGSVLPTSDVTTLAGEARTTATLGTTSGTNNNTFDATAALTGSPVTFTASADSDVAVSFDLTGHPSPSTAGTSQSVTVTARDQYGNVATGYTGTIEVTSSDGSGVLPADYTFLGGDNGVTTVSVELRTAGTQDVTATDTISGSINGTQAGIQVDAGAATDIVYVSGDGQGGQISTALALPLVVRTEDAFGNPVAGETVNFAATVGGGGVLPASDTTNAAGEAQTVGTVGSSVGTDNNTFEATAALTGSPITFLASVTSGPADHIVYVSGDAQTGTVGAALAAELVVRVEDAGNNPVTGYSVDFAATAGGGGALPASNLTDAAGEARTTATLGTTSGTNNNTFDATATLTGSPITFTASADADVAVSFDVTGHPSPSTAGTSQSVTVTARDQYGNAATGYTGTIAVTSTDGSAVLPADYTFVGGDNGVTTVSVELRTAGTQSVTVTDTVSAGVNGSQGSIQVDPAGADHLGMVVDPSNSVAGVANAPAIEVEVLDAFGNRVTAGTFDVAFVFGNDASGGSATLGGTTPVTTSSGVATFSDVTLDIVASGYTLTFSAAGVATGVTSAAFDISAAGPDHLGIVIEPTDAAINVAIAPAIVVEVLDAFGNRVTTGSYDIAFAFGNDASGGSATLGGTSPVASALGLSAFSDVTLDTAATGYTLAFSAVGVSTGVTSAAFDVTGSCTIIALATATGVGGATTAFPWDTIVLNGTGSTDCGASVTYAWSVAVTADDATEDEVGGFLPWTTLPTTATGPASVYYVQEPGSYVFTLTVDDSGTPYTDTATITVAGFTQIPYGGSNPAVTDSRQVSIDPGSGDLFIGIDTGDGGQVYDRGAGTIQTLTCLSSDQSQSIAVSPAGVPHFGHANDVIVDRVDDVAACIATGTGVTGLNPSGTASNDPARTRQIYFPDSSEDFYIGTDDDVFFWDDSASSWTEYTWVVNGSDAEYRGLALDHDGDYWFASYQNAASDRTVKTSDPSTAGTALDIFTTANDKVRAFVRGILIPSTLSEMWVCSDTSGIAYYADAATASTGGATYYTAAGGDLLDDEVWEGRLEDGTTDLWFVSFNGINRFKRDVGAFATVSMGTFGLPTVGGGREMQDLEFDEGNGRGRILYLATRGSGVYQIAAP